MLRFFLVLLLLVPLPSYSAPKDRMVLANFKPHVTWRYEGTRIFNVCHKYPYGHWKYRRCRMAAQSLFKDRCKLAKDKVDNTQGARRKAALIERARYCKTFRP